MQIYYKSDVGLVRKNNQDYCLCKKISDDFAWAVVCDGMGGAKGGNIASSEACKEIEKVLEKDLKKDMSNEDLKKLMKKAVASANEKVFKMSCEDDNLDGMGTTVELTVIKDETAHIVHAGDSRVYKISGTDIFQETKDHSLVQQLVDLGQITPEEARVHPSKNYITRALGVEPYLETDYITAPFRKNDILLMCTDGLSNYFGSEELLAAVRSFDDDKKIAEGLVNIAKECGGSDNITVAVLINK